MKIPSELLGCKGMCICNREHEIPIEQIVIDEKMLQHLQLYLETKSLERTVIFADPTTYEVLGEDVYSYLVQSGLSCKVEILSSPHGLLPDEQAISIARNCIVMFGAKCAIAVGSGVINDITRCASFQEDIPYVVVATAPSMDGYASSVAAMQFNGVKTTLPARTPKAIFADPNILCCAPFELIQAGFGDLIGKIISLSDWKLSSALFGEYFCATSYEMVRRPLEYCINHAGALRAKDSEAVKNLFIGLINSGLAMAMVGNSRPCSGSEHHCSHYWDLLAYKGERRHASHGLQVGYATQWMVRFYRSLAKLVDIKSPAIPYLSQDQETAIRKFYQGGAQEIIHVLQAKEKWHHTHSDDFLTKDIAVLVHELQPELSLLSNVEAALRNMGISSLGKYLDLDLDVLRETFLHANELRSRYTIFDFLVSQGELERTVEDIIAEVELSQM